MTDLSDLTAEDVRRYLLSRGWREVGPSESAVDASAGVRRWATPVLGSIRDLCGVVECDLEDIARYEVRPLAEVAADVRRLRDEARIPALPLDPDVDAAVEALARRHDRSGEAQPIPATETGGAMSDEDIRRIRVMNVRPGQEPPVVTTLRRQRDEARAEVERLRRALAESKRKADDHRRQRDEAREGRADWQRIVTAERERDELRDQVDRLRIAGVETSLRLEARMRDDCDVARLRAEVERLRAQVAELDLSASMACETPPDGCDCAGCRFAEDYHNGETDG